VETILTCRVDSHHTNRRYQRLLVNLLHDPTFHYQVVNGRLEKADLMPTDDFVLDLALQLARRSPTFYRKLEAIVTELCMER